MLDLGLRGGEGGGGRRTASLISSRCSSVSAFKGFDGPAETCAAASRCKRSRSCLSRSRRAASRGAAWELAPKVLGALRSGSLPWSVLEYGLVGKVGWDCVVDAIEMLVNGIVDVGL